MSDSDKDFTCAGCTRILEKSHRHGYFYKCDTCRKDYALYDLERRQEKNQKELSKILNALTK